jgi:hypothetical protein
MCTLLVLVSPYHASYTGLFLKKRNSITLWLNFSRSGWFTNQPNLILHLIIFLDYVGATAELEILLLTINLRGCQPSKIIKDGRSDGFSPDFKIFESKGAVYLL